MEVIGNLLSYNGCKTDIMPNILKLVKQHSDNNSNFIFNDVFGGSGVVSLGVAHNFPNAKVNYNEFDDNVFNIIESLKMYHYKEVFTDLVNLAKMFPNVRTEQSQYLEMKDYVNSLRFSKPWLMIGLTRCAFSSTPRWSKKSGFNNPWGRRHWHPANYEELFKTTARLLKEISLNNKDAFIFIDETNVGKNILDYYDPPYSITTANYMHGWGFGHDQRLADKIDERAEAGNKFILSNVLSHRQKSNFVLEKWLDERPEYQVYTVEGVKYNIANRVETDHDTHEILVTNIETI